MATRDQFAPETIRSKEFSVRMRGFETTEVADYLSDLADLVEDLQSENQRLVATNRDLRAELDAYVSGGAPKQAAAFGAAPVPEPTSIWSTTCAPMPGSPTTR